MIFWLEVIGVTTVGLLAVVFLCVVIGRVQRRSIAVSKGEEVLLNTRSMTHLSLDAYLAVYDGYIPAAILELVKSRRNELWLEDEEKRLKAKESAEEEEARTAKMKQKWAEEDQKRKEVR